VADAGRVIAGSAKGVRLAAPGAGTRPLADKVKQAAFAALEPDLPGASMLDLFAGSGAAGIEALSRGAARAVFVERDAGAASVIRENVRRAGFDAESARIVRAEATAWLRSGGDELGPWDIAFVDPPYDDRDALSRVLEVLARPDAPLAPDARVVVKHFWRDRPREPGGLLASERERRFGETALTFFRRRAAAGAGPEEDA
jgi:16S rRNA (guanine966-N2)-methyltransferase